MGRGRAPAGSANCRVFHRELGDELAVYRCETGTAEVYIYFIGVDGDRLAGLLTVSIET